VDSAATVLRDLGYEPVIYPHAFGRNREFSGTHAERYADQAAAFTDTTIRAILCSRGGYGVVHNLDRLATLPLRDDPKWVIGFSDISALHALMASNHIASIHASMAKHIKLGPGNEDNAALFDILAGGMPSYQFDPNPYNQPREATGKLLGGNLAVIADLINTPFDIIHPGTILFIEDVSEPVYKIERILYQLKLSGILPQLKGLIIGQFTEYKPDAVHETMEAMIHELVKDYDYPVAFGVPVGHVDHNVPLVESSQATLRVTPEGTTLTLAR
ncbi:MAG: LD-carboxypeptidase, partial [Muribaculaceae bacterium]|nr:LD-carboxypeptidase [Muribaculaceae bacterium]